MGYTVESGRVIPPLHISTGDSILCGHVYDVTWHGSVLGFPAKYMDDSLSKERPLCEGCLGVYRKKYGKKYWR